MTTEIQTKRLKVLIRELKILRATTDRPKFNMSNWMSLFLTKRKTRQALHLSIMEATREPCGTACCLAGKAGLIPAVRRMGFKWDVLTVEDSRIQDLFGNTKAGFQFNGFVGDYAVQRFFGAKAFEDVFMNYGGIRTLLGGITALEAVVEEAEDEANKFALDDDDTYDA